MTSTGRYPSQQRLQGEKEEALLYMTHMYIHANMLHRYTYTCMYVHHTCCIGAHTCMHVHTYTHVAQAYTHTCYTGAYNACMHTMHTCCTCVPTRACMYTHMYSALPIHPVILTLFFFFFCIERETANGE